MGRSAFLIMETLIKIKEKKPELNNIQYKQGRNLLTMLGNLKKKIMKIKDKINNLNVCKIHGGIT